MGVNYNLFCDDCREWIDLGKSGWAVWLLGGMPPIINDPPSMFHMNALAKALWFVGQHHKCDFKAISDHDYEYYELVYRGEYKELYGER